MSDVRETSQSARLRIARRIRCLRVNGSLTQESLAQRAGLASRHLQKIEAGEVNVTLDSLVKLANALEVDLSELFTGAAVGND